MAIRETSDTFNKDRSNSSKLSFASKTRPQNLSSSQRSEMINSFKVLDVDPLDNITSPESLIIQQPCKFNTCKSFIRNKTSPQIQFGNNPIIHNFPSPQINFTPVFIPFILCKPFTAVTGNLEILLSGAP